MLDRYIRPAQAALKLGIHRRTFDRHIKVPRYRIGGVVLVKERDIQQLIAESEERPIDINAIVDDAITAVKG